MPPAQIIQFRQNEKRRQVKARWSALFDKMNPDQRRAVLVWMDAWTCQPGVPYGLDGELIGLLHQMTRIRVAIDAVDEAFPDNDRRKAPLIDHLAVERDKALARVRKLDGPKTPKGARVVALVLLSLYPDGVDSQDGFTDWLAVRCAECLLRQAPA